MRWKCSTQRQASRLIVAEEVESSLREASSLSHKYLLSILSSFEESCALAVDMASLLGFFRTNRSPFLPSTLDRKLRWSLQVLWTVPIVIFLRDTLIEINYVDGQSMSPTLSPDFAESGSQDVLAIWKWGASRNVQRGDIVAFWSPQHPEKLSIKRIIAMAGDKVYPKEGRPGGEEVPYGHVWVEGDNWRKTWDSNNYGPISKSLIAGKATHILWPLSRIGALSTEWHHPRTRVVPGQPKIPKEYLD